MSGMSRVQSHQYPYNLIFTISNGGVTQAARRDPARVVYPKLNIVRCLKYRYWQHTVPVEEVERAGGLFRCSVETGN